MRYAADTQVSTDKSILEIKRTLNRYGADAFMYAEDGARALISFKVAGRFYKIGVDLPDRNRREFTHTLERGKPRTPKAVEAAYEQAIRQRWRALSLAIKAVLEAAESGIWTLEQVLQSFALLPDGSTVGAWLEPQINEAYLSGKMPQFLPLLEHKS